MTRRRCPISQRCFLISRPRGGEREGEREERERRERREKALCCLSRRRREKNNAAGKATKTGAGMNLAGFARTHFDIKLSSCIMGVRGKKVRGEEREGRPFKDQSGEREFVLTGIGTNLREEEEEDNADVWW